MPKASILPYAADDDPGFVERRKSERVDVLVRVDYQTVDELFSDFARNINEGGLFVETERPAEVGTLVSLQFRIPGSEDPVMSRGRVVRVSAGDDDASPGMGIEFEHLDDTARSRIDELVRKLRSAPPRR
jgi:type IV pilus assembly protein PilZ